MCPNRKCRASKKWARAHRRCGLVGQIHTCSPSALEIERRTKDMWKRFWVFPAVLLCFTLSAIAADRDEDIMRIHKAADVFHEIMSTPDKGIPQDLLASAKCIAIIPVELKFAFVFGGNHGRGVAMCRKEN